MAEDKLAARTSEGGIRRRTVLLLAVVNGVLWALGIASTYWFFGIDIGISGVAFSTAAVGLWTFLVFSRTLKTFVPRSPRHFLLSISPLSPLRSTKKSTLHLKDGGLFKAVWDSFNPLMIAIIGFYFGGKAFEKSATSRAGGSPSQSGDDPANEGGVYRWLVSLDSRSVRKGVARDRAEAETAASDALDELSR